MNRSPDLRPEGSYSPCLPTFRQWRSDGFRCRLQLLGQWRILTALPGMFRAHPVKDCHWLEYPSADLRLSLAGKAAGETRMEEKNLGGWYERPVCMFDPAALVRSVPRRSQGRSPD